MDKRTQELNSALSDPNENDDEMENELPDDEEEKEDEKDEKGDEEESDDKKDDEGEEDKKKDDDKEENDDDEKDKPKIKNPDRWHGKSREDVIREIESIEGKKETKKETGDKKKDKEENADIPSNEELAKMSPKEFVQWVLKHISSKVDTTVQERTAVQQSVAQEIREAKKEHPLLKTSAEYRELVLALIDNAAQKGVHMPLKEACAKVDAFSGTGKGETTTTEKERTRLKKAKAVVERGGGSSTSPDEDKGAEAKRLETVFGTGGSKSPLGGLGV